MQLIVEHAPTGARAYIPEHKALAVGTSGGNAPPLPHPFGADMPTGSSPEGDPHFVGTLNHGNSKAGKGHLVWVVAESNAFHDSWEMDNHEAAITAQATISAALNSDPSPALITIDSDGSLVP